MQLYFHPEREADALAIARDYCWQTGVALSAAKVSTTDAFFLWLGRDALQLHRRRDRHGVFLSMQEVLRRSQNRGSSLLAKSLGFKAGTPKSVLDAMAGFGLDSMLMARWGFEVTALEVSPVIYVLLLDGLQRFSARSEKSNLLRALNMDFAVFAPAKQTFDIVYLDPMFPRRGKMAQPNKRAQYLSCYLNETAQPTDLKNCLQAARKIARERVVLKRRRNDPLVSQPDWQIRGKSVRFDVFRCT